MSVYKVPQDVEAEDKLLGPFSFRQFIFLIIAVVSLGAAYILARVPGNSWRAAICGRRAKSGWGRLSASSSVRSPKSVAP